MWRSPCSYTTASPISPVWRPWATKSVSRITTTGSASATGTRGAAAREAVRNTRLHELGDGRVIAITHVYDRGEALEIVRRSRQAGASGAKIASRTRLRRTVATRDETSVDQARRRVEIHQPDGVPDILQQIEHGTLFLLAYPVRRLIDWLTSHFVVKSDRIIHRRGFIAKYSMEVPLEAIRGVSNGGSVFPHTTIVVDEQASLTFVDRFSSEDFSDAALCSSVVEVEAVVHRRELVAHALHERRRGLLVDRAGAE